VPDFRNTRAVDVVAYLQGGGARVSDWEPLVSPAQIKRHFGLDTLTFDEIRDIDAVVLINAHKDFRGVDLATLRSRMQTPVLVDVKNFFPRRQALDLGFRYISL